jgi:hypothetical protein
MFRAKGVSFVEYCSSRKIALRVRFAEVKEEAAKLAYRRKIKHHAAGGHEASREARPDGPPAKPLKPQLTNHAVG